MFAVPDRDAPDIAAHVDAEVDLPHLLRIDEAKQTIQTPDLERST
jgi:hypothetical protein